MKHFLAPKETKSAWYIYILSIVFVLVGMFSFSVTITGVVISSIGELKPGMTEKDILGQFTLNQQFVINMIPFAIGFLLLFYAAKIIHKRTFLSFVTLRERLDLKRILVGTLLWGGVMGLFFMLEFVLGNPDYTWQYNSSDFLLLLLLAIVLTPIQTGFEEVLIRGFTLQFFGRFMKLPIMAIVMSTVVFALLHGGNPEMDAMGYVALTFYLLSGLLTALITVMDDGIELSWGFHLANNLFSLLIVTSDDSAIRTDALFLDKVSSTPNWQDLIVPFLIFPLFIFLLAKIYKWKNWKEKLFGNLVIEVQEEETQQDEEE